MLWEEGAKASKELIKWCQDQWHRKLCTLLCKSISPSVDTGHWCQTLTSGLPVCYRCCVTCPECREDLEGSPLQLEMEILDKGNKKKVRGKRPAEDAQDERVYRVRCALLDFDEASVSTIHGFCSKVLKHYAFECGHDFDAELLNCPDVIIDELWISLPYSKNKSLFA